MSTPVLLVVIGSTRPGRISPIVARWFAGQADGHGGFEVRVADLAEVGLPLLDEPEPARTGRYVHQHTRDWSETVAGADAVVFVTPEYNHGYPAALKNAIDYLAAEWKDKPAGFVSYGGVAGGVRAVAQLKSVVSVLGMIPVADTVLIPMAPALIADGELATTPQLDAGAGRMLDELLRVASRFAGR